MGLKRNIPGTNPAGIFLNFCCVGQQSGILKCPAEMGNSKDVV